MASYMDAGTSYGALALACLHRCCLFNNMARYALRFVFGSLFPQERIFNNFSASFSGSFGFVFGSDSLFSVTSPVRFSKKVFFFVFDRLKTRFQARLLGYGWPLLPAAYASCGRPEIGAFKFLRPHGTASRPWRFMGRMPMPLARRPLYAKKEDYHTRPEQSSKIGRLALPSVGARSFRLVKSKTSKQDLSASTSASVSAMPMNTRECGLLTVANPWGIL